MAKKRSKIQHLDQGKQVAALRSAVRQEIVDALQATGACSVARLAEITGRAPDSLYYHIRTLHKVGLLREVETRRSGRRDEVIWDVAAEQFRLQGKRIEPGKGVSEMMESALNLAVSDLRHAIENGSSVIRGAKQNTAGGRFKAWLNREELDQVLSKIKEVQEIFYQAKPGPDRELTTFGVVVCPVQATQRKRS